MEGRLGIVTSNLFHRSTISTNFIRTKMAKKDSYEADKEDDKGKHLNRKKGKRTRKSVCPGHKFRKKLIDSVSMEEEVFFSY